METNFSGAIIVLITCLTFSTESLAFSLSDHTWITAQAVNEFNQCVPQAYSEEDLKALQHFDILEDLNLLNKWIRYSHYYRPFETLDMYWRSDSSARVEVLGNSSFNIEVIGGILHYLQDAASPPHVVPVSHGLTDGFEKYSLSDPQALAASWKDRNCEQIVPSELTHDSALSLLPEAGLGTLHLLSELAIHAKSENGEKVLVAPDFWQEAQFDSARGIRPFGQYGDLGNSFGEPELVIDGVTYQVSPLEYDRAKVAYLRLGVEVSKKLLFYWWNSIHPSS